MTFLLSLLFIATAGSLVVLVRDIARDPARSVPSSHADGFAQPWSDAGAARWSL